MRGFRKVAWAVLAAAAWWLVSCREIPAPADGVQSISALTLPSPGLVAGDTMRDSLGLATALNLIAYNVGGLPLDPQPVPTFVVIDTGAHLAGGRYLVGDTPGTTVRVVGTVSSLQTNPVPFLVTLLPDTLQAADSILHHVSYVLPDTAALTTLNLSVLHRGTTDSGVGAVIVRYAIDKAPPSTNGTPTVVLLNGNVASSRDTSESNGRASRSARLRLLALTLFVSDTVLISATSSHRGASIGTVQFTIIFTKMLPP